MSLSELEEYEREQAARREKIKTALRWVPLTLAGVLLAAGGLSVWSASSGHDEDRVAIETLTSQQREEADLAEESLHESWSEAITESSAINPERVEADRSAFGEILTAVIEDGMNQSEKLPEDSDLTGFMDSLASNGVPGIDTPMTITDFDPVLASVDGTIYTWKAVVALTPEDGEEPTAWIIVDWSMDDTGAVTDGHAAWTTKAPQTS